MSFGPSVLRLPQDPSGTLAHDVALTTQEVTAMHAAVPTKTRFEPTLIAPDTFLVHDHQGEGTEPVSVALNTMVIRAAEPVVVDTGMMENRTQYLEDVFSLVEPEDIRWVFISHDDVDHTGNLNALMDRRAQRHPGHRLVHAGANGSQPRGPCQPLALGAGR